MSASRTCCSGLALDVMGQVDQCRLSSGFPPTGRDVVLKFLAEQPAESRSRWLEVARFVLEFPGHLVNDLSIDDGHESLQV